MSIQAIGSSMGMNLTTLVQTQASIAASTPGLTTAPKAGGPPPAGGGGSAPPAAAIESSSAPAAIYDKRDTNQDGVVSYQEDMIYTMQYPTQEAQSQIASSTVLANPAAAQTETELSQSDTTADQAGAQENQEGSAPLHSGLLTNQMQTALNAYQHEQQANQTAKSSLILSI